MNLSSKYTREIIQKNSKKIKKIRKKSKKLEKIRKI